MRKIVLSIAAAGAALVAASPATAQYYPQPQPYAYNGYGYNNGFGQVRALQARIDNVARQINRLDRRDRIRDRSADRLRRDADRIEDRLHRAARNGLDPREAGELSYRIQRLEQQVQVAMNDRGRWGDRDDRRWDRRDD
jgi:cell division protein FtsB